MACVREADEITAKLLKLGKSVATLLADPATHIFICGLKGMETGVEEALADVCRKQGRDWSKLRPEMRASGRYHVETY